EWRCQPCHHSCHTCHGPSSAECDICLAHGCKTLEQGCIIAHCLISGKLRECRKCNTTCSTCFGQEGQYCSSCSKGYYLDQVGSCVRQCPSGSYLNPDRQQCVDCSSNCEECVDTMDNCISCSKDSNKPFLHLGRCWSSCPDGFFEGPDGTCEACDSSCLTCDEIKSQCLSCPEGHFLDSDGSCVTACPAGTYNAKQEADGQELGFCLSCDRACSTCTAASPRDCLTCSSGYLRLYQLCLTHCPTG
uniref:R-spondin Fu-CRD domain-containing protein n=1 Tax=Oryzias melastigma TaxID=30732 RepID=A0A3B3CUP6_ORYME